MKQSVKTILKQQDKLEYFTEDRYKICKELMKLARLRDRWVGMYLSLDPLNKAQWIADHIVELVNKNLM